MRRLYLQIYFGFVVVIVLLIAFAMVPDWLRLARRPPPPTFVAMAERVAEDLPRDGPNLDERFNEVAHNLGIDATLWTSAGEPLASTAETVGPPRGGNDEAHWLHRRGPPGIALPLPRGRWLAISIRRANLHDGNPTWPVGLLIFAAIVAVGALPVARRITRRLERLQVGVERLGTGDLSARVPVEGRDEVADLATSFNRSAERIEHLVDSQRRMLASASHELRTPLARLRVASELMGKDAPENLRAEAAANIAELDDLIEDLLLAARLQGAPVERTAEATDVLALAAEEAARLDAQVHGSPAVLEGDPRLLRRLVRNLLQNARRYGGDTPIEISVEPRGHLARLEVADRGPGIPEEDRERVFEAFYRPKRHSEGNDGGVGLGLALVREIARRHGGDAICLARPGGGTLLRVELGDLGSSPHRS